MAELFMEILCEEIPARMQEAAEAQLAEKVTGALVDKGLGDKSIKTVSWSGPRRLAVAVSGVLKKQRDIEEERRGPRADADEAAVAGFLKSAGIKRSEAEIRTTEKGDFYFARIAKKGKPAKDVLPEIIAGLITDFNWPKTMRWGRGKKPFVRPVHGVVAVLDGKPLSGAVDFGGGVVIPFGNKTQGHRILGARDIAINGAKTYEARLKKNFVIAGRDERKKMIEAQLAAIARTEGLKVKPDAALVDEVAGLVEYPHAIMGNIDMEYMDLPAEILTTSMRSHQKYFAFEDRRGNLAPRFATIANMKPDKKRDAAIRAGNERVLKARLDDARFFWDGDCDEGLASMGGKLGQIMFFRDLGTMAKKAERVMSLAGFIAKSLDADVAGVNAATRAGKLAKADLASRSVGEFPELQGIIGGHLARRMKEGDAVALAITEHYLPQGPDDPVPSTDTGRMVALADKIDTLSGFFAIGQTPTGSKDPFALRRAALGVIRILVEGKIALDLGEIFSHAHDIYRGQRAPGFDDVPMMVGVMAFLHDRLKVWLREEGVRHDVVDAVVREHDSAAGDLHSLSLKAVILHGFIDGKDGAALMAGYARVLKIHRAEEAKDNHEYNAAPDVSLFTESAEKKLHESVMAVRGEGSASGQRQGRDEYLALKVRALSGLRAPVDGFFDAVIVNHEDEAIRRNRLNLLGMVRAEMEKIADFSKIEG